MTIERHDATVMTNEDPEKRGRIKVACAGLIGDEETELPQWIEPNLQWGWFVVPDPGEIVEIEASLSDDQDEVFGQSSVENIELRWGGKRSWTNDEVESGEARPINEDFKTNYGKRRGFATPNGHIIFFDDTEGGQKINVTWKQDDKYQYISFDEKGNTTIANANGSMFFLDSENGAITIIDEHGNHYTSNDGGLSIVDKNANYIEMKDGVIQIVSQGNITMLGGDASVNTGTVHLLSGATEKIIKGDVFRDNVFDPHIHASAFGPTGPPDKLMSVIVACLSQNGFIGD